MGFYMTGRHLYLIWDIFYKFSLYILTFYLARASDIISEWKNFGLKKLRSYFFVTNKFQIAEINSYLYEATLKVSILDLV